MKDNPKNIKTTQKTENELRLPSYIEDIKLTEEILLNAYKEPDWRKTSKLYRLGECVLLLICGALFSLAFPAHDFALLGWVGMIPLFAFTVKERPLRALCNAYVWMFGFTLASFYWFYEILWVFPLVTAIILSLFPAAWGLISAWLYRYLLVPELARRQGSDAVRLALIRPNSWREAFFAVLASATWVVLEWVRSWIATGLPWNNLATSQWQNLNLIQIAEFTGFYGVSFCVILVNLALYFMIVAIIRHFKVGVPIRITPALFAGIIIMLAITFPGGERLKPYTKPADKPYDSADQIFNIGLVQTANPIAWGASMQNLYGTFNRLANASTKLAINHHPDVILWPETVIPLTYSTRPDYQQTLRGLVSETRTPHIIGAPDVKFSATDSPKHYNSALLFNAEGKLIDEYSKRHIVPFGEFIPFGGVLDALFPNIRQKFALPSDLTPGNAFRPLTIKPGLALGVNICFEDVFPYVSREFVRNGATVLATITNDGWYPKSHERAQHLANAVFRAVETRRYFVRTGNYTQACLINPIGYIEKWDIAFPGEKFDPMSARDATLNVTLAVPRKPPLTFYTQYGDVFVYVCLLFTLIGGILAFGNYRDEKRKLHDAIAPLPPQTTNLNPNS